MMQSDSSLFVKKKSAGGHELEIQLSGGASSQHAQGPAFNWKEEGQESSYKYIN